MSLRSYLNRPAKYIERLMLVEAFRRLAAFGPLPEYAYVGFGAHEFVDFELVWRTIGVTEMTSIEKEIPADRFQFNRPFGAIIVEPGTSATVLPKLTFKPHTIVWLDYTGRLSLSIINDLVYSAGRLGSGSVLVVTVNAEPETEISKRRAAVVRKVGAKRVPAKVTDATLAKWGLAELYRDILSDEVSQAMRNRPDTAEFEQLFNFRYADSTRMLTWGGVIVADQDRQAFTDARFGDLEFVKTDADACLLAPPVLTLREMLRLNDELPLAPGAAGPLTWLSKGEVDAYSWLHRWYPPVP
jgi:hypothetical protein